MYLQSVPMSFSHVFLLALLASLAASEPSVIIIGSGASGIAAATKFLKHGLNNVTVLEAEDRIGGRVYSVHVGSGYVDLGAEWCHGEKSNIVYKLIKDFDVLRSTPEYHPDIYHYTLKKLEHNFSVALVDVFTELILDPGRQEGSSIGDCMIKRYQEKIAQWKGDQDKYALAQQAVELLQAFENSLDGSFSWDDVTCSDGYVESKGDFNLHWNGRGYKTILEVLMQKYPDPSKALPIDNKVLLKKEVEQIDWSSKPVVVKCTDGTTYSADHVIVTVSLGVLKHQHNTLFKPQLPADKIQSIEQLGIAAVHKVLYHFDQKWWNDSFSGYAFIWDSSYDAMNHRPWLRCLSNVEPVPHNPNILEAWFVGKAVPEIEQLPDKDLIDGLMYTFDYFQVLDSKSAVRPDGLVRNNWYTNPHFRGTYSYDTPNTRQGQHSDRTILSLPLGDSVLLFAGESTSPTHYGTVHGAIDSGFREADRLIKMYT